MSLRILLLGAGFSRNWGGWLANEAFEYLLGCPEVIANADARAMLWKHKDAQGFEGALGEARRHYILRSQDASLLAQLNALNDAVTQMFAAMNAGFFSITDFNLNNSRNCSVSDFLTHFDAIFTLNQDLLLERHYIAPDPGALSRYRRSSVIPCIQPRDHQGSERWCGVCAPVAGEFGIPKGVQPYFKLHGSSNWHDNVHGAPMMIMGVDKVKDRDLFPLLVWYQSQFEEMLCSGAARLMIIGYGFRDHHINETIVSAVQQGARLFIVGPSGANSATVVKSTYSDLAAIKEGETTLESALRSSLDGASRRALREIFNTPAEFDKLQRFIRG